MAISWILDTETEPFSADARYYVQKSEQGKAINVTEGLPLPSILILAIS